MFWFQEGELMINAHQTLNPIKRRHDKRAPYWAAAMVVLGGAGLATNWIDLGAFWKGYVLDMTGPAWNYILFRGLFTSYRNNAWIRFFTPRRTLLIFLLVCVGIEVAQYFKMYEATYDPLDFLAYVAIFIPLFLIDLYHYNRINSKHKIRAKMKKLTLLVLLSSASIIMVSSCSKNSSPDKPESIKAYNLDFNWGEGGPNAFAEPGLWADANPQEHIKWYKDLGVNIIQTFIVSCNGYAWYKDGVVPEQPGLKHDFLPEMVRLGHKENIKVMGYLCIGSNTRWGMENPDYSYGYPADRHIPYTKKYLEYLDGIIRDAVKKTNIDGFMIDWFYQPNRSSSAGNWLDSEKERYEELMGKSFPGVNDLSEEDYNAYSRLAIEACWNVIYKAAKETNPDCLLWLTSFDITHPHIVNSKMFKEIDWLMNEEGDVKKIDSIRTMVGKDTQLITCLASWNKKDPVSQVTNASKNGVGLYGFVKPNMNSLMAPIDHYLSSSISNFSGDDKNIATLARIYNNLPLDYIKEKN